MKIAEVGKPGRMTTGLPAASNGLSTDFLSDLAAARPGLSTAVPCAGFAAVTGRSVDFDPAGRGMMTAWQRQR